MKLLSENYIFYMRFRKGITYFFLIVLSIVTMLPLLFLLIYSCAHAENKV